MGKQKTILFIILISLFNCNSKTINDIDKAIRLIEKEYETKASYKIGTTLKFKNKISFIEIKVKGGNIINSYDKKFIPMSNIATIAYNNIRKKFDEYRIELIDSNNESTIKHYSLETVKLFLEKRKEFDLINSLILKKKFDLLHKKFYPSILNGTSKDLSNIFKNLDKEYGECKDIIIHGYLYGNLEYNNNNYKYVAYFGIMKREISDNKISVFIDQDTNKILSFKLDW